MAEYFVSKILFGPKTGQFHRVKHLYPVCPGPNMQTVKLYPLDPAEASKWAEHTTRICERCKQKHAGIITRPPTKKDKKYVGPITRHQRTYYRAKCSACNTEVTIDQTEEIGTKLDAEEYFKAKGWKCTGKILVCPKHKLGGVT